MLIEHVALWTRDLETMRDFYCNYFDGISNEKYTSVKPEGTFESFFLTFGDGARLELMRIDNIMPALSGRYIGYAHIAFGVGGREDVDGLTVRMVKDGINVISAPRVTGDGYYEAAVRDPDGNIVEIVSTK